VTLFLAVVPAPVSSQDNVQRIKLSGLPVTIEYAAGDEKVADKVSSICEDAIPEIAAQLGLSTVSSMAVYLIADMPAQRDKLGLHLPAWGVAFAFMEHQAMLVDVERAANAWNSLEKVIPHELSHLLVAQSVHEILLPRWFAEGLAMWQSGEWSLLENWRLMEAVWGKKAPTLGQIAHVLPKDESSARNAYRVAYSGFAFLFDERFDQLPVFLQEVKQKRDFSEAFASFFAEDEYQYYARFDEHIRRKYSSRLLLFQTGPLFTIVAVLFLLVFVRIKLRNRRKLRALERIDRGLSLDDRQ
jgi:hypothetical protein